MLNRVCCRAIQTKGAIFIFLSIIIMDIFHDVYSHRSCFSLFDVKRFVLQDKDALLNVPGYKNNDNNNVTVTLAIRSHLWCCTLTD